LAQLLDQLGDKDAAWRQLRAAQAAGLPPDVAKIVDRYSEALREARPQGLSLEVALAPDSNISRATRSDTLGTIFGDFVIDEDSRAKSGMGVAVRGQSYRRFAVSPSVNILVRGTAVGDLYRRARYNDVAIDLAAGPEMEFGRNRLTLSVGTTRRWYGQKLFETSARTTVDWYRRVGRTSLLHLSGTVAAVNNALNRYQDGKMFAGQAEFEHALSPSAGGSVSLALDRSSLKDPGYSLTGWRAGLLTWRDIGRTTITAEVERGRVQADERLILFPRTRSDRFTRVTIGTNFRQLSFRGFAPITRLVIERNPSTIEFYAYRRMRTEFALVRAF
jgi:hypothetical protein